MNIFEGVIIGLIVSFIGWLFWLANTHPHAFSKISAPLSSFAFAATLSSTAYDYALTKSLFTLINHPDISQVKSIIDTIESYGLPLTYIWVSYFAFAIYLTFLDNLHYFLKKTDKDEPE